MRNIFFVFYFLFLSGCSRNVFVKDDIVLMVNSNTVSTKTFGLRLSQKALAYDSLLLKNESVLSNLKSKVVDEFIVEYLLLDWIKNQKISLSSQDPFKKIEEARGFLFKNLETNLQKPTDQELQVFYKEKKDSHFTRPSQIHLEQVVLQNKIDAEKILEKLLQEPSSFASIAKSYSISPESSSGGDLGWINKGGIEVFEKAFSLPLNTIKGVFESPYGFHIFRVKNQRPSKVLTFEESKSTIKKLIEEQKINTEYFSWLEKQLRTSNIKKEDSLLAKIKISTRSE